MDKLTEMVARAIAANKRKLSPDDPTISEKWTAYCGQARAAVAAVRLYEQEIADEYERAGLLWRNPAPHAAAPMVTTGRYGVFPVPPARM